MKFLFNIFYLIAILFNLTFSQNTNLPAEINEAIELIDSKEYSSALIKLQTLKDKFPERKTIIEFLIIKCSDELNRYENVEKYSTDFLKSNPQSKYLDNVQIFLIKSLTNQNKFQEAFEYSIELLKRTKSISMKIELKNYVENNIAPNLDESILQKLSDTENVKTIHPFILFLTAKKFYIIGDKENGDKYVNKITTSYITSDEYLPALNLKFDSKDEINYESDLIVGVMFPLTNQDSERDAIVEKILDGVKYAFHEFNKDREDKIGLIIEDTKNDSTEILRIIKEFDADKRIKCVIGPIYSTECADVIKNIKLTDLVFISPTATDEDLTENNDQFFQANPPFDLRGKALAQYVYFVESLKRFAVINSIEGYSTIMANAFINEFKKLGGEIVFKETFRNLQTDLSSSISKLRNVVNQIDGIYLPISQSRDAELLISELDKLNLKIPVFGTQDWLEAKGLESSTSISKNIRITSDYFIDYQDKRFVEFSKQFSEMLKKEPTRFCLYGYDTAKHLINILKNSPSSRYGFKLKINSDIKTVGFKNNISFGSKRRNSYINVLKYSEGKFSLIERFKANE